MNSTDLLFKLLYHRSFRKNYLLNPEEALQLEKASQQIVLKTLENIKIFYSKTLKSWGDIFTQDGEGFELVYLFLESPYFLEVHNLAFNHSSKTMLDSFAHFLNQKLPKTEKFFSLRQTLVLEQENTIRP